MSLPARAAVSLVAAILSVPADAVSLRMDASTTWADNISRSAVAADQTDAWRHDVELTANRLLPLATGVSLITGASMGAEIMPADRQTSAGAKALLTSEIAKWSPIIQAAKAYAD